MGNFISVSLTTLVVFLAMITSLAAKPDTIKKLNICFVVFCGISGLLIYGYGYSITEPSKPLAVVHTLLAVCSILVGGSNFDAVSGTPFFQQEWAKILFWVIHLMARYAFASAAVTVIGAELLQRLRLFFARWGELHLIYGLNQDSFALGKSLMGDRKKTVLFIDGSGDGSLISAVSKNKGVLRVDADAVEGNVRFLKSIGFRPGSRKMTLYALKKDSASNLKYAEKLLFSMKETGITPEQTSLVILGKEESVISQMQVLGEKYGYGYVTVYQEAGLAARLLTLEYPPCDRIVFDQNARAQENFEVLQVGFGQMGQAVLRQMVMHGQFEGSTFRADIVSTDSEGQIGFFANSYSQVLEKYDIRFHQFDARSRQMYDLIRERGNKIKYIVLCAGSEKMNREIAEDLTAFFSGIGMSLPIHICSYNGITTYQPGTVTTKVIYRQEVISMRELDKMAMLLNHYYCADESKTPVEHWMVCDYFSRMSSRASADFTHAMLRAAGKTREQVAAGDWNLTEEMLENLSRTEHLRWCAFHYCMGFHTMTDAEFDSRAQEYRHQVAQNGKATIRIGKNMEQRTHACLVDWDALDTLSRKENAITGQNKDYKALDRANVQAIPKMLG